MLLKTQIIKQATLKAIKNCHGCHQSDGSQQRLRSQLHNSFSRDSQCRQWRLPTHIDAMNIWN